MSPNMMNDNAVLSNNIRVTKQIVKTAKEISDKKIYSYIKRGLDIFLATVGLIILLPLFAIIGIVIKIDSKGPVFFAHNRVGKNGKTFKMYKFRTMYKNAQDMIKDFNEEQIKEWKENYKLRNDPRITKVGNFLRKTSLDELPQIWNIIKGDLSIIGPRPVIDEEVEKYGENKEKFLSITPGLTGYWQANGRNDTTYEERIQMELYYVDNVSWKLDVKIFFKTIISVIKREGAM